MSDEVERKVGRPAQSAISRALSEFRPENRSPVGGYRDILTVKGKDPDYVYRWVDDDTEEGSKILRFIHGGYEFAPAEGLIVGQQHVYKSKNNDLGSVVRVSAGKHSTGWLYLMRIKRDWYEQDQQAKTRKTADTINSMKRQRNPSQDDGQYGGLSISSS